MLKQSIQTAFAEVAKVLAITGLVMLTPIFGATVASADMVTCSEFCEHYDTFDDSCDYRTQCVWVSPIMRYTHCELWDTFDESCNSEATESTLARPVFPQDSLPSCVARCQYWDTFNQECDYRTQCIYQNDCLAQVTCEHWDAFSETCPSERFDYTCRTIP